MERPDAVPPACSRFLVPPVPIYRGFIGGFSESRLPGLGTDSLFIGEHSEPSILENRLQK